MTVNPWRNYDVWKLRSMEDDADERERRRLRDEDRAEWADEERDRLKDEPPEDEYFNWRNGGGET